jgi:MreB/Mrl family cell shape determining protein
MISVPAGVTSTERRAVIEAAIRAGAKNAYVVKEPILAAIGAGISIQDPCGNMIVDIGGGTTDVAVISLGGIVVCSSVKCAGTRIDGAIIDYVKKNYNLAIGEKTAEDIEMSETLINEQKQLRRKQRMQKTFGDDSLEIALLENDSEKTEKISDKKAEIKIKVKPAPDQKDQQGDFSEMVQKILKN